MNHFRELIAAAAFVAAVIIGCAWTTRDAERSFQHVQETVQTPEYQAWLHEQELRAMRGVRTNVIE